MGRISEDKIQEIRDRTDIVEVVGSYLPLKHSGANHQGLCPFHQEKSPSFNVNSTRQIFHCFGCGVGGNVFSFLMRMEGLSFPEAVKRMGEKVGVEIEEEAVSPAEIKQREERERMARINQAANEFYHQTLLDGADSKLGRHYLRQRGYEGETVRSFQLGFAPEAWEALSKHLQQKGFSVDDLRKTGLVRPGKQDRGDYDLFRNRLLFPIHDLQGQVVGFGGRVLDDSLPKYINSPESPLYNKSRILYGLYQARDAIRHSDEVLVVEGYFDVLALHRAGFEGSVATCGTALTADHARLLKRYAKKVLLVFDQDKAGRQATFRAMDALLPVGLSVNVVELPVGDDPDSLIKVRGEDGFRTCLEQARPVLEVFIEEQLKIQDSSIEGRVRAAEEVLERLRRLPSDLERSLYLKLLAERTGLGQQDLQEKARSGGAVAPVRKRAPAPSPEQASQPPVETGRAQKYLLRLMLNSAAPRNKVRAEGIDKLFPDEVSRGLAEHLLECENADGELPENLFAATFSDRQQSLLSELLLLEDDGWADNAEQIFEDCRRATEHAQLRQRLKALVSLEQQAQQQNDEALLVQCLRERTEINQKLKKKP